MYGLQVSDTEGRSYDDLLQDSLWISRGEVNTEEGEMK